MPIVKRCLIALAVFLASLYFFPDWESYFELKKSLDMLFYTKLTKYAVLIYSFFSLISNLKKLSILGKKEKESSSIEETKVTTDISEENKDPDLEILRNKQKLKTKSEKIIEKHEGK